MRIAFVGCGYVADLYMRTLVNHPSLELAAVTDIDPERLSRFAEYYGAVPVPRLEQLLDDGSIDIIVNLTNPSSHFAVSKASLEAGKHVYSEKPLATEIEEARELVALAEERGLLLASAPCGVLGESFQTLWKAFREKRIGNVLAAYGEMDDGLIHRTDYRTWVSESGAPWPYKDEFETGCTLEHAGYYLTWLPILFGPARTMTAFATCSVPDKQTDVPLDRDTPDFSVACIEFSSGVVARLTCSIIAPPNRSLTIIGDEGLLYVKDCWDYGSPVYFQPRTPLRVRAEKAYPTLARLIGRKRYPLVRKPGFQFAKGGERMDFSRGICEMQAAISEARPCRLSARYALHVNEMALAIHNARSSGATVQLKSDFPPPDPAPWAS